MLLPLLSFASFNLSTFSLALLTFTFSFAVFFLGGLAFFLGPVSVSLFGLPSLSAKINKWSLEDRRLVSVTRLGDFYRFLATICLTKVAQIFW